MITRLLPFLILIGCTQEPTTLRVQLVTDLAPGREIDTVEVRLDPEGETRTTPLAPGRGLGRGIVVGQFDALPPGRRTVTVRAMVGGHLVQERTRSTTLRGGITVLPVLMTADCNGVLCGPGSSCSFRQCLSADCTPERPSGCPSPRLCSSESCGGTVGCLALECRPEGACFAAPDDALCAAGEYCDRARGCAPIPAPGTLFAPVVLIPANGAVTPARPLVRWSPVLGAAAYQLQIDDSCDPFDFAACTFESPEVQDTVSAPGDTSYEPALPLAVATTAPIGRRYFFRARACDDAGSACSAWSRPTYADVGRARGDVNGDGFSDVIAGSPLAGDGAGGAYIMFGAAPAPMRAEAIVLSPVDAVGPNDHRGQSVAYVGDANADGCADFVIGSPGASFGPEAGVGVVLLLLGSATTGPGRATFEASVLTTGIPGGSFGFAVAGAGDLDADGRADLVIGAPGEADGGAVYTLLGRDLASLLLSRTPPPVGAASGFGTVVVGVGDLGGLGHPDVLVSSAVDATAPGRVYHFRGSLEGLGAPLEVLSSLTGSPDDRFGAAMVGCDVDADGEQEIVIGAPGTETGRGERGVVAIIPTTGAWRALTRGDSPGAALGTSLDCGEVTGDATDDIVVSDPPRSRLYVFAGGEPPLYGFLTFGFDFGDFFASRLDVNGDGATDTVVGDPASRYVRFHFGAFAPGGVGRADAALDVPSFGSAIARPPP